jgi:Flp pilus assembly protein TadG
MKRSTKIFSRFTRSDRGVAAVEFAFILPVMLLMLFGAFDGSRAIAAYLKVRAAVAALANMTNTYTTIHDTDMTNILGATSAVLSPYTGTPVVVLSQLQVISSGHAKVSWSSTLNGTALTVGSSVTIPTGFTNSYVILCSVSFPSAPVFGYFPSITFSDSMYTVPRVGSSIARISP